MKSKIEIYVGLKVREFRLKKGWTQQYLADVLNLSNTFIANRENPNGTDAFNLDHIDVIARSEAEMTNNLKGTDIIMFGPHLAYKKDALAKDLEQYNIPFAFIDKDAYGAIDGAATLKQAMDVLKGAKPQEVEKEPVKEVEKKDVRIDSIKLEKEDNNLFLRIVIDSDEIIDVDKCVEVTNIINPLLDEKDLIKESYILDVSTKEKGR